MPNQKRRPRPFAQRKRPRGRPFPPGQSGNPTGQRKGLRNKRADFPDVFFDALARYGGMMCKSVATEDPKAFLRLAVALLPRQPKPDPMERMTDEEFQTRISALARELGYDFVPQKKAGEHGEHTDDAEGTVSPR